MSNVFVALRISGWLRTFGALFGVWYLAVAVCGWVTTGWSGSGQLLGLSIDPAQNLIHSVAALVVMAALAGSDRATGLALTGLGNALGLVAVLGFLGVLDRTAGGFAIADPENFFHLATGAAALSAGLMSMPPVPLPAPELGPSVLVLPDPDEPESLTLPRPRSSTTTSEAGVAGIR